MNYKFLMVFFLPILLLLNAVNIDIANANNSQAKKISLEQAIAMAVEQNGYIVASKSNIANFENLAKHQSTFLNPVISGSVGGGNNIAIGQEMMIFGKRKTQFEIANYDVKKAQLHLKQSNLDVILQVINYAFQYKIAKEKYILANYRLKRFNNLQTFIKTRAFASPQEKLQKEVVEAKLSIIKQDIANIELGKKIAWNNLNLLLNLPEEYEIELGWLKNIASPNLKEIINGAISGNIDLNNKKLAIDKLKKELDLSALNAIPNPNLQIGNSTSSASGGNNNGGIAVGLSLSVPIFNYNQYQKNAIKAQIKSLETEYNFEKKILLNQIDNAALNFTNNAKIITILPISKIATGLSNLAIADNNFLKGTIDFINYLELDLQNYEVFNLVLNAQYNYITSYLSLLKTTGEIDIKTIYSF